MLPALAHYGELVDYADITVAGWSYRDTIAGLVVTVAFVLVLAIPDTENNENRRLHE